MVREKFILEFNERFIKDPIPGCITNDINVLRNISFGNLNVNSLNLSTHNKDSISIDDYNKKVTAFLKHKLDIIALQDIRMNSRDDILSKSIRCTPFGNFSLISNSNKSKRGVCLIFKQGLNIELLRIFRSKCNNVLLVDCLLNNFRITIGSIYGPVYYDCIDFFPKLKEKIMSIGNKAFIISGDMNCLTSLMPPSLTPDRGNLDTLNIASIPNEKNSEILNDWIRNDFCIDLFRTLNPLTVDYSCAPFRKDFRSRIDHVLCPNFVADIFKSCHFNDFNSALFDHKLIIAKTKHITRQNIKSIDNTLIDLPGLEFFVKEDIYIFLCEHFKMPDERRARIALKDINTVTKELTSVLTYENQKDPLVVFFIENCERKLEKIYRKFPSFNDCIDLETNLSQTEFLSSYANCIKNSVISFQSNYIFNKNCHKKQISEELSALKNCTNWSDENFLRIKELESQMSVIEDQEILREIVRFKHFDTLNAEKPTKMYCKLLKNSNKVSINLIKNSDGNNFCSEKEREEFLVKKFEEKFDGKFKPEISLEDFLGDYKDHDFIKNCKLTNFERLTLDSPITMNELNLALNSSNFSAAVGPDGLSMSCIRKFWDFLSIPILNYFNSIILEENGELYELLRCAFLRLIPKTGEPDLSQFSEWRAISILSALYKLFSKILDIRMEKIINKLVTRAQKGYSKKFVIQEALINTIEHMSKAIHKNIPLAVLNVDFRAAFDTVSYDYFLDLLRFYGFGNNFIKMFAVSFKNRFANIIMEDKLSRNFSLNSGFPQGAVHSPRGFNIGTNPLLSLLILHININLPPGMFFNNPTGEKVDSCGAFADDLSLYFNPNRDNLLTIKRILDDFYR